MHVGTFYRLVTSITQFCLGSCNIYHPLWQANSVGHCRCFKPVFIFWFLLSYLAYSLSFFSTRRSWRSCVCRQSSHVVVLAVFACLLLGRPFTFSTSLAVWEVWIGRTLTLTLVPLTSNSPQFYTVSHVHIRRAFNYLQWQKYYISNIHAHASLILYDFSSCQSEKVMEHGMRERKRGLSGWVLGMTCVTLPLSVLQHWPSPTSSNRSDSV